VSNGKIGKLKKLKRLGSGSSGSVWLCESKSGEHVAVKLLEQNLMQNENSLILDMFSNEIEISEKLSHPNIVNIQGHHISDDSVFIVMEYIDGGALDQFDSPDALLSFEQLIAYAIPSCKALEFAASQGFIHCDIKPSNIFLSQDGTVKVSDFGAGLLLKNGKAKPEIVLGSPAYMSPEQVQCEEMSVASDIYSFGAALYRLTTGRLPFFAEMNPGISLPDLPITVVHRDDHSGSTYVISSYLTSVSDEWKSLVGAGTKLRWLTGVKAAGSSVLGNQVSLIKGAIGYVDFGYAKTKKMSVAQIKNASGAFVKAGPNSFLAASKAAKWSGEDGLAVNLVNTSGADSWPITTATYVIVKRDVSQDISQSLEHFVSWAFKNGDQSVNNELFVPLPPEVKKSVEAKLAAR